MDKDVKTENKPLTEAITALLGIRGQFEDRRQERTFAGIITTLAQVFPEEKGKISELIIDSGISKVPIPKRIERKSSKPIEVKLLRRTTIDSKSGAANSGCTNCDKATKAKYEAMLMDKAAIEEPKQLLKEEPKKWVDDVDEAPEIAHKWESVDDVINYFQDSVESMKLWCKTNKVFLGNTRDKKKIAGMMLKKFRG